MDADTSGELARRCAGRLSVSGSFLVAFELEFLLAHPAFEVLFRLAEAKPGIPSLEEDYRAHIDEFVAASNRFRSPDPAMAPAAKLLRGLWEESRSLANNLRTFRALSGIVPIRMHCKAIRNNDGRWAPPETNLNPRTGVHLSYGVCPTCLERHYPEFAATET